MSNKRTVSAGVFGLLTLVAVGVGIAMFLWVQKPANTMNEASTAYRFVYVYFVPIIVFVLLFFKTYLQKETPVKASIIINIFCAVIAVAEFVFVAVQLGGMSMYLLVADEFPMLVISFSAFIISLICDFARRGRANTSK